MKQVKTLLKNLPHVRDMQNARSGEDIPSQFVITTSECTVFKSYWTIIAMKVGDKIYLDAEKWDYSKTTGKYRNQFLGLDKKETEKQIKSGEIILIDLNN